MIDVWLYVRSALLDLGKNGGGPLNPLDPSLLSLGVIKDLQISTILDKP